MPLDGHRQCECRKKTTRTKSKRTTTVTEDDDDGESNFHADDKSLMTRRRNDSDAENQVARTKTTTTMSVTIDKDENDAKGNDDDVPPHVSDNAEQDRAEGTKPNEHDREDNNGAVSQRAAATGCGLHRKMKASESMAGKHSYLGHSRLRVRVSPKWHSDTTTQRSLGQRRRRRR